MNPVKALQDHGQAVWLDFLSRGFIVDGGLKKLVEEDGLHGVTSNPTIFEQAIGHTKARLDLRERQHVATCLEFGDHAFAEKTLSAMRKGFGAHVAPKDHEAKLS
jgi:transaldolase